MPKITDETRKKKMDNIIQAALVLFSRKGYSETTIDDIVASAGMSKGSIYSYFKSKEEIFLAIAKDRFNKRHDLVKSFEVSMPSKDKIKHYIEWVLHGLFKEETLLNARFTFEFWTVASRNHNIFEEAKKRYSMFYDDLSSILKEGIERGEFKEELDIESMCYIILSSIDGIGYITSVMGIPLSQGVIDNHISMILLKILK